MNRKIFGLALGALLLAFCVPAVAQQPKKVPLIGYLASRAPPAEATRSEPVRLALRELGSLGSIEGENIAIEYRY
jgi:putative ABC transport system substrate-binding protein